MKPDLAAAFTSFDRGLEILQKAAPGDAAEQKNREATKINLLANSLETHGVAARFAPDPARLAQAGTVLEQYIAAEPDAAKRTTNLISFANNMNGAGELKSASDNLDALAGLGLALYTEGSMTAPPDKTVLQEGLNYMQRFVDAAPDSHQLKESTKAIIEELKNEQKLAPQKTTPAKRKG
jgi:hypothetical protein